MGFRAALAASAIIATGLVAPVVVATDQAQAVGSCTKTSSGHCIAGGQLCPQSKYNHSGFDAHGHRYVCKGPRAHPHWEKP